MAPPALPGFLATMTLSETQAGRHPDDRVEAFAPLAPGFPQLLKPPSRRAVLPTPVDRFGAVGWHVARSRAGLFPNRVAFPERTAGRHPQISFRGLLELHSRYGPPICSPTYRGLCHQAPLPAVTRRAGSLAIQVYRHLLGVGLSPTGDFRPWGARSFGNFTLFGSSRLDRFKIRKNRFSLSAGLAG